MRNNKRYSKENLINEISKDTQIRKDVVRIILESFVNIAVREIVLKGEFLLKDLFSVTAKDWKGYKTSGDQYVPDHKRLTIRLSTKIKKLFKHQQKIENSHNAHLIDKDNWRNVLDFYEKEEQDKKKENPSRPSNPFVEDY